MNNLVAAYFSRLFVDILSFYLQSDSKKILLSHIFLNRTKTRKY